MFFEIVGVIRNRETIEWATVSERLRFLICVRNDDYPASLEPRKIYQQLHDPDAADEDMVRVVDESGDDYLYPKDMFVPVELSGPAEAAILRAS